MLAVDDGLISLLRNQNDRNIEARNAKGAIKKCCWEKAVPFTYRLETPCAYSATTQ